jgi:hypothetical protein
MGENMPVCEEHHKIETAIVVMEKTLDTSTKMLGDIITNNKKELTGKIDELSGGIKNLNDALLGTSDKKGYFGLVRDHQEKLKSQDAGWWFILEKAFQIVVTVGIAWIVFHLGLK